MIHFYSALWRVTEGREWGKEEKIKKKKRGKKMGGGSIRSYCRRDREQPVSGFRTVAEKEKGKEGG